METLVAIVVVSIAMLGILAMYAAAVLNASDAIYRAEATFLADQLVGRMRLDDRRPEMMKTRWEGGLGGTDGSQYSGWVAEITALNSLPGIADHPPRVSVEVIEGFSPPDTSKVLVTITLRWLAPHSPVEHSHVVTTSIH